MTKRILIILIILVIYWRMEAQSYEERIRKDSLTIELINDLFHSPEIKNLKALEKLVLSISKSENPGSIVKRNLQFNAEHHIWRVNLLEVSSDEYFSFIIQSGELIAIEFRSGYIDKTYAKYIHEEKLKALKQSKEEEFGKINLSTDLLFPLKMKIFGHWCSIDGAPPEYCLKMLDLVNQRNRNELKNWLLSFDPEIQAYGVEGMFYLEREGILKSKEEVTIIDDIEKINNTLIKCEGCFFYVKKNFSEDFHRKYLRQRYKAFKTSRWIYQE